MPDTQPLIDQSGQAHDVPIADVAGALDRGWRAPTAADTSRLTTEAAREADYGGTAGGVKAAAYGLLRGGTLGASDVAFRAAGAKAEDLRGYAEQFPKLTLGAETLGALVPALASPESLLARNPAGGVAAIGRTIVESAEHAGPLAKIATAAAGGATEGALFSGGSYLSQVALEDKPLAAEGFLGAMGKGALWAAPIGAGLAIGESVLHRAKGLFPRSQVTKEAAREADQAATSAITDTVRDGDLMVEAARRRLAQTRAQAGAAQSAESASRAMFGAADPATIENQVTHSVDHAKLTDAVNDYTRARSQFEDWVRAEADPDLEAALLRLNPSRMSVQGANAPKLRAAEFGEVVPPPVPFSEFSARGTPGPHEPPRVPITTELPPLPLDKTTAFDSKDLGLSFDPKTRTYHDASTPWRKADEFAPSEPVTTFANRPSSLAEGTPAKPGGDDQLIAALRKLRNEVSPAQDDAIPEYRALKQHLDKLDTNYFEQTISARALEERGWYELPSGKQKVAADKARDALSKGETPVVTMTVTPSGKVAVSAGREALDAAVEAGAPVRVKWTTGAEPAADEVLRGGETGLERLVRLQGKARASTSADGDLEALLQATKGKLDSGESIAKIGAESPARAEYVAAKAAKGEEARTATKRSYTSSEMAADEAAMQAEARAAHDAEFSPIERDAIAQLRDDIHAGRVPGYKDLLPRGEQAAAELEYGRRAAAKTIVDRSLGKQMRDLAKVEDADGLVKAALRRRNGKNVDIGPNIAAGARAIDNLESASATLVDILGPEAPKTAIDRAVAYRSAVQEQAEKSGASAARAAADIKTKVIPADQITVMEPTPLPKGPVEQAEFARLQEEIKAGRVPGMLGPFTPEGLAGATEREMALRGAMKTVVDKDLKTAMREARSEHMEAEFDKKISKDIDKLVAKEKAAEARHGGPGGQSVARAIAGAIDDIAGKIPQIADATSHAEGAAAGGDHKKHDPDKTVVDDDITTMLRREASREQVAPSVRTPIAAPEVAATAKRGGAHPLLSAAADIGTALEVLHTMGVHTPDISSIPVIGPVLGMYLKARAVLGILGRKGGSIGLTAEGLVASKSAAVRDRMSAATQQLLEIGSTTARKAMPIAGPAGALAHKLFPGDGNTTSKDPRVLYEARMDEISRALQPGAIEHAIADRIPTSDPDLQAALAAQARRGVEFLASKAPKQSLLTTMLPGDGKWHPSKAALETFARYVAAVNDPAGVLEDLARGHVSAEGAETLRVVYPQLFAEAQRTLLQHAPDFQKTLPYTRRVSISLMFRVPVDGTMSAQHMQYLMSPSMDGATAGAPGPAPQQPAVTGPLNLGQQTMTSLERRAGS